MTPFKKDHSNKKDWILIDAENLSVGRLAAYISMVLRGKNKPTYGKHYDDGDFIVVTNVKKIKFSGKKMLEKKYYKHTGYPGGIKEFTPKELQKRNKSYEKGNKKIAYLYEMPFLNTKFIQLFKSFIKKSL